MNINSITLDTSSLLKVSSDNTKNNVNFEEYLKKALDRVNEKQVEAENATIDLITGQAQDIHQVMLATEEARLTLELAVQIRNKLVDAYQEIMRIQI
ncbi:flagellar hook-basal body complex protein FliE [Caloramator australicus]|uniref:Flagellar hook-basal body complex protein FliE n=1 Tax=Caloramator australicus RC3 TaxID=857293 RepID=I7LKT8_9CLOT|nr:flagellar hook-basal body complex protein FliE [Caloramator australicus]CCJ34710.1 Flagellar hook-basal body complex protein FliE [Caloramator australicus RC3]